MGYSTTMRYTGMSGVDTSSMITQLMQAESMRKNTVFQQRQLLQYTQDAYRATSNSVRAFQTGFLSFTGGSASIVNMRSTASYGTNKGTITGSDGLEFPSSKGSISVSSSANTGDYEFTIDSVAGAEKRLGGTLDSNTELDMDDLTGSKIDATDSFDVTLNGVTRSIDFSKYVGANDKETLKNAFDAEFGSGKITVSDTGISVAPGNTLSISEGSIKDISGTITAGLPDEIAVGSGDFSRYYTNFSFKESSSDVNQTIKLVDNDGNPLEIKIGVEIDDTIEGDTVKKEEYLEELNKQIDSLEKDKSITIGEAKMDDQGRVYFESKSSDIDSFNGAELEGAKIEQFSITKDGGTAENIEIVLKDGMTKEQYVSEVNSALKAKGHSAITASLTDDGNIDFKVTSATNETYKVDFNTSVEDADGNVTTINGSTGDLAPTSSIQKFDITSGEGTAISMTDSLEDALGITVDGTININGVDIAYTTETTLKEFMSEINNGNTDVKLSFSETTGKFTLESTETGAINNIKLSKDTEVFDKMMLTGANYDETSKAEDTKITYDGVTLTRESNIVEIDGITLNLNKTAKGEIINVNVQKDTEDTVSNITKFIEAYNEMVDGLQNELSTSRPKSGTYSYYEPLTDEERSSMSDTEQEQWDEKAKEGMLYNDSLLRTFTSAMRSITYDKVELPDGTSISMQDLGITTGDYKDGGKLIIDEEKLQAAIEEHGDDIATLFTKSGEGIADKMNTAIENAFGTKGYVTEKAGRENSVTTNENALSRAISQKDDDLTDLTNYLIDKENYYYTMFAAMEQSIIASNNQMSYLMSM